jgi:hypothetical protein
VSAGRILSVASLISADDKTICGLGGVTKRFPSFPMRVKPRIPPSFLCDPARPAPTPHILASNAVARVDEDEVEFVITS